MDAERNSGETSRPRLPIETYTNFYFQQELPSLEKSEINIDTLRVFVNNQRYNNGNTIAAIKVATELLVKELLESDLLNSLQNSVEALTARFKREGALAQALRADWLKAGLISFSDVWKEAEKIMETSRLESVKCFGEQLETKRIPGGQETMSWAVAELVRNGLWATKDKNNGIVNIVYGEKEGEATISVIDNGEGMGKELRKALSEPLYLDKGEPWAMNKCFPGPGYGLLIAWLTTTRSGGKMTIKSAKDVGTMVTLSFPFTES